MTIKLFITGTDTGIGKTYVSIGLIQAFNRLGLSTLGLKPVSSGCFKSNGRLYNQDALQLQQVSSVKLTYRDINPFAFSPPIAPHLAAQLADTTLSVEHLNQALQHALQFNVDVSVIEGVGGWFTPLNAQETMAHFVLKQKLKCILVVGLRLGCLNHALLTYKLMQQSGVNLIGWIANSIDPEMLYPEENIASLQQWLRVPYLGNVHYGEAPETTIDVDKIMRQFEQSALQAG